MPDVFHGDSAPVNSQTDFDLDKWRLGHGIERVTPIVEAALKEIKKAEAKKIGGVGYCFGAKYVVRHLKPGNLDAGFVAHPSFVETDEMKAIQGPLSIAAAGKSMIHTPNVYFEVRLADEVGNDQQKPIIFFRLRKDARPKISCSTWISHSRSICFRTSGMASPLATV